MQRILTIQDLSCVGRCSLTVALPTLSAMGVEAAALPTAVLSANTQIPGAVVRDLTEDMPAIAAHWMSAGIAFDGILTGYLASPRQVDLTRQIIRSFRTPATRVFVDPAMADNGRLYAGFGPDFPRDMARLCEGADVILPNATEACLLLGEPCRAALDGEEGLRLAERLLSLGAKSAVVTGVETERGIGAAGAGECGEFLVTAKKRDACYHGTGDLFAAAAAGSAVRGASLERACRIAADYVSECIRLTPDRPNGQWFGVEFERAIPYLLNLIEE